MSGELSGEVSTAGPSPQPPPDRWRALRRNRARWGGTVPARPAYRNPYLVWSVVVVVAGVTLGLDMTSRATPAQQSSDLHSYYSSVRTDVASCASGLRDSLTALKDIVDGTQTDLSTARSIAGSDQSSCTPVVNDLLYNLATQSMPNSLSPFHLQTADNTVYRWAYPQAALAIQAVGALLAEPHPDTDTAGWDLLARRLHTLDATAAHAQGIFDTAARRLHTTLTPLGLRAAAKSTLVHPASGLTGR